MPGPAPKPANQRQRRNRASTATVLPTPAASARNAVPELPEREGGWHPMVLEWWTDVWRSPMASEYLAADVRGLYRLAVLEQDFWQASTPSQRMAISSEIRHASLPFGLNPTDRRRLQWEVERAEEAVEKTVTRRARKASERKPAADPREAMRLIS